MAITDAAVATAVITEAKAHNIFPGEMPADDASKIAAAGELVRLAEQAKAAGVVGAPVLAVLGAAGQGAPAAADGGANPFAGQPAPAAPPVPEPVAAPAVSPPGGPSGGPASAPPVEQPAPAAPDINQAIPGYDDLKVGDVLTAMEGLNDAGIAFVKAYEAQEGERAKILNFERHPMAAAPPAAPPVQPEPAQDVSSFTQVDPSLYASTEPWPGYAKAKITDIVQTIETTLLTRGEEAKPLLAHVWEYESNNKERTRLLDKLKDIANNGVQSAPPAPPAPPPVPQAGVDPTAPFAQPQAAPAPVAAPPVPQTPPDVSTPEFDTMVPPFENGATQRAETMINKELPVPPVVGQAPDLPGEFTGLSDVQVRSYQAQFNALQARAHYMLALAEGYANDAKLVADNAIDTFIRENTWEGKVTVKEMEAKALALPEIQHARRVQHEWGEASRQLRARRDIYQFTCERLSREQTGRADERSTTR